MRGLLLLILLVLVVEAVLVGVMGNSSGYVLLAYGDTTVEMSMWTAAALAMAIFLLLGLAIELLLSTFRVPGKLGRWRKGKHRRADFRRTNDGQIAYIEGDYQRARQSLNQVAEHSDVPVMHHLISAKASEALGDEAARQMSLQAAEKGSGSAKLAVGLAEAEMQLDKGQLNDALETMKRVGATSSTKPAALKLMAQIYQGKQDWPSLRKLLPELRRTGALTGDALAALERRVYGNALQQEGVDKHRLDKTWKRVPREAHNDPELLGIYARKLAQTGQKSHAERILREALNREWNDGLVTIYGQLQGDNVSQQLANAESWLKQRSDNPDLLLATGRLAMANRQWDKARNYLQSSLKLAKRPDAYAELGRLLEGLGETDESLKCFEEGLLNAAGELPKLPLPSSRSSVSDLTASAAQPSQAAGAGQS